MRNGWLDPGRGFTERLTLTGLNDLHRMRRSLATGRRLPKFGSDNKKPPANFLRPLRLEGSADTPSGRAERGLPAAIVDASPGAGTNAEYRGTDAVKSDASRITI